MVQAKPQEKDKAHRRKITELHEGLPEYWAEDHWYQDEGDSGED